MRNKYGQTPQEVARATVLFNLERMATTEGYAAFEETPSFKREVRKHFAKINNTLEENKMAEGIAIYFNLLLFLITRLF